VVNGLDATHSRRRVENTFSFSMSYLESSCIQVTQMFYHGFDNYMEHAFPLDELKPLSCTGEDSLGGYTLTLVDSLDMLALLGDRDLFSEGVNWIGKNLRFDKNKTVSVFETTIRMLGGLLSAHLIASDSSTGMQVTPYHNELLHLAEDLGRRMLPAFETPTGIPFGSVNLVHGVSDDESQVTSTAGGGTLTLEFGVLSRLTGDPGEDLTVLILKVYDELFQRITVMGNSQRCDEILTVIITFTYFHTCPGEC